MKIRLAKTSGFCMGVKNAVLRIIREIGSSDKDIYIYGPLIHNPQTIDLLSSRGLTTIRNLDNIDNRIIAIRTHGIPLEEKREIEKRAGRVIDLTCPRVIRVQKIIGENSARGAFTIITGDKDHAEVKSLKSYASSGVHVISGPGDIEKLPSAKEYFVVSQTTFDEFQFNEIVESLKGVIKNLKVFNTICGSAHQRQEEMIREIKNGTDAVVVTGGRDSANTGRLAEISRKNGITTFHAETGAELDEEAFADAENVFVIAGASTPGWIINNVLERLDFINSAKSGLSKYIKFFLYRAASANIFAGIGAFFLSLMVQRYINMPPDIYPAIMASLFAFASGNLGSLPDAEYLEKTGQYRFNFLNRNKKIIRLLALLAAVSSIALAIQYGVFVCAASITAFTAVLPHFIKSKKINRNRSGLPYRMKNLFDSAGWVLAAAIIPMARSGAGVFNHLTPILFIICLVFTRNTILDMISYQGDMMAGRETIPVLAGTGLTAKILLVLCGAALIMAGISSYYKPDIYPALFSINIIFLSAIIVKISKMKYLVPVRYETLTEMNFILFMIFYPIAGFIQGSSLHP